MHYTNAFIRGSKQPFRGVFKYKDANAKQAAAATIDEVMERRLSPKEVGSFA